jgi:murein L,D-transpeptidase YcbB/YkuD
MEARFFLGTELARRHRVVVGNNDTETDAETGKRGKLNQTRLFTAEMQTVVLNPVWNVPRRIKEQELDLLLMDEPDYYEKHGFKIEVNADGSERVVQQPGPGNALGLAKFLFPNQFAIYMHDTPKKNLFDRPVRAFSHGCMRTHNPLDLARWILVDVDKELTNEQFDAVLEAREERHFAIRPRIPITIDYVTTTIDEAGRINFLSDVYGFDKEFFEGRVPLTPDKDFPLTVIF